MPPLITSISVYGAAVVFGYVVFPLLIQKETLALFLSRATDFEATWRDRLFLPLTRRMTFVSPNFVTMLGFLLTGVVLHLFWIEADSAAIFAGVFFAGFTDMLDGPLARNNNRVTPLGARLDWTRDLLLTIVVGVSLAFYGILKTEFLLWFLVGWAMLGVLRIFEFKITNGTLLNTEKDYKFILDRLRLAAIWLGALFLILAPYHAVLGKIGEALTITAIAMSWCSVLLHAAHLAILRSAIDIPRQHVNKTEERV